MEKFQASEKKSGKLKNGRIKFQAPEQNSEVKNR